MCAWRQSEARADSSDSAAEHGRALSLLLEGVAINLVQIDPAAYRRFRSGILRNSIRLGEPQSETDLLATVSLLVREFETYRTESEAAIEANRKEWRRLTALLMELLSERDQIDITSDSWHSLTLDLAAASNAEAIQALRERLQKHFSQSAEDAALKRHEDEEEQDRSTANDNAAGLRGGGAAIEHLRVMLARSRPGFIGLFRLSCLDVVGERFGTEGIQDCLMAVSAFLIQNMRSEDVVYHWSDSSLLAIFDRKVRQDILAAELNRVLAHNRDFTINIGDRTIMLRIPIDLELFPIADFESAEDLQCLPAARSKTDRSFPDRGPDRSNLRRPGR